MPTGSPHRSSKNWIALGFCLVAAVILIGLGKFALFAFTPAVGIGANVEKHVITVQRGSSPNRLAETLEKDGVVTSAEQFLWLGRITRLWGKLKAGEYEVSPTLTPLQIFKILTSGVSMNHPLTIREGENMYEIADEVGARKLADRQEFLDLCKDPKVMASLGFKPPYPKNLEGYLFPETYFFNRTTTPDTMIRQMVRRANAIWTPDLQRRADALGLTRHQVVTLASIIEKETGAPEERPMISSVFHNRLKKKMRLQSDPTTIYGIWHRYRGNLSRADLSDQNEHNTYMIPALPVGPIGNPGREAIQAALHPSLSDYLYFVSHNDGTHEFTRTYEDHLAAVKKFQIDRKEREGKSWRDRLNSKATPKPSPGP